MQIAQEALQLIEEFEGCLKPIGGGLYAPYIDPVGIPTIGIGSIWRLDGSRVQMSDPPITKAECYARMDHELQQKCVPAMALYVSVPLHPFSEGAAYSFMYNCGVGAFKISGFRKAINERRWSDIPGELAKWRMGGGRVLPGLVRRRKAEADLFMRGVALQRTAAASNDNGGWLTSILRAA